jgi:hypothetical protein
MHVDFRSSGEVMLSVGKLFAIAAILALMLGFARWPSGTGAYTITIKSRAYGFGPEYWAFTMGAIFAVFAAIYYWFPIVLPLNSRMSNLHFWLSAFSAFGFLVLAPGIAFIGPRSVAMSQDHAVIATLVIAFLSLLVFLIAQTIFAVSCFWSAFHRQL